MKQFRPQKRFEPIPTALQPEENSKTHVSIVVSVYNAHRNDLASTLWTASHQTFRSDQYEVVVVDDASTNPDTLDELALVAAGNRQCRVVRHDEHRGRAAAQATGASEARGDFVMFIDAGDALARDSAESLFYRARSVDADVVAAPQYLWDAESQTYQPIRLSGFPFPAERWELIEALFTARCDLSLSRLLIDRALLSDDVFALPQAISLSDVVTTVRVLLKARSVSFHNRYYCYRLRDTSHLDVSRAASVIDALLVSEECWRSLARREIEAGNCDAAVFSWIHTGIGHLASAISSAGGQEWTEILLAEYRRQTGPDPSLTWPSASADLGGGPDASVIDQRQPEWAGDIESWLLARDHLYPREDATGVAQSAMSKRLAGKVVLVCQVDYQIRAAVRFAAEVRRVGHACVILDNSHVLVDGRRASTQRDLAGLEGVDHIVVESSTYEADWFGSAEFVAVFNDFIPAFRDALEYRHRLGLPTACVVEGINDFERTDFTGNHFLSYRRCDFVFTAGDDDARFFDDRCVFMVGLPGIEDLASMPPRFPHTPLIAVNLNFTYGVLSPRTPQVFFQAAQAGLLLAGLPWVVTRHPMDQSEVPPSKLYRGTQFDLIDECTVFVSRFATGILEALASGKPAIYFNPHGERVDKFLNPLGAFEIATTSAELAAAVERAVTAADAGIDFRARADDFLRLHAGWSAHQKHTASERFTNALQQVVDARRPQLERRMVRLAQIDADPTRPGGHHASTDGSLGSTTFSSPRPWYADAGDRLRSYWPAGHAMMRGLRRELPPALRQRRTAPVRAVTRRAVVRGFPRTSAFWNAIRRRGERSPGWTEVGLLTGGGVLITELWGRDRPVGARRLTRWARLLRLGLVTFLVASIFSRVTTRAAGFAPQDPAQPDEG